ncbi:hypothetical protein GGR44_000584 [Sphingobium fontiphilum]|uniref:Uncharacterized protein n=1 Tax=Sphingobium fontiphilum TaxID=944425 RepID=A0A7W6DJH3_9SPHN|nr:hypothetical protein [Sphingobium fontiphilum]MBB3980953.1 hypothetical protein [Sphingobium fontiphilum]
MADPKPLASLTSGLLARKGAAQPAMRRQSIAGFGGGFGRAVQDDLGWNDMGHDVAPPVADQRAPMGLTPMAVQAAPAPLPVEADTLAQAPIPAVIVEREELAERVAAEPVVADPAPVAPAKHRAKPRAASRKAAFTLRLDAERHLKLRLACAVLGQSAQQMVTQALDAFLASQPDIDRLAGQVPPRAATLD